MSLIAYTVNCHLIYQEFKQDKIASSAKALAISTIRINGMNVLNVEGSSGVPSSSHQALYLKFTKQSQIHFLRCNQVHNVHPVMEQGTNIKRKLMIGEYVNTAQESIVLT